MIHFKAVKAGTSNKIEGWADRIRVHYTENETTIFCLENGKEIPLTLGEVWEPGTISEFWCEKFTLRA